MSSLRDLLTSLMVGGTNTPDPPPSPPIYPVVAGHPAVDRALGRLRQREPAIAKLVEKVTLNPESASDLASASPSRPHQFNIDPLKADLFSAVAGPSTPDFPTGISTRPLSHNIDRTVRHEAQHLDQYRRMREAGMNNFWDMAGVHKRGDSLLEHEAYPVAEQYVDGLYHDRVGDMFTSAARQPAEVSTQMINDLVREYLAGSVKKK